MNTEETTIFGAGSQANEAVEEKQTSNSWKRVTIGGVTGILMGAAIYATNAFGEEAPTEDVTGFADSTGTAGVTEAIGATTTAAESHSHIAANGLRIADVDQSLPFGKAFALARAEVGPGGVFHWHGNIYNTYTIEEWNDMSASDRAEFAHLVQPEIRTGEGPSHRDMAQDTTPNQDEPAKQESENQDSKMDGLEDEKPKDEEPKDVESKDEEPKDVESKNEESEEVEPKNDVSEEVEPKNDVSEEVEPKIDVAEEEEPKNDEPTIDDDEPDVHFLGVEQIETADGQTMNVGVMVSGEQEVALVDVDDNRVFDVAISDHNKNGYIEEDEVIDISDRQLSVDDFAIASALQEEGDDSDATSAQPEAASHTQDHLAEDMPDYMNDADLQTI